MQYFANTVGVEQIKARYRELAMQYHPDRGGDTQIMQDINREYHERLKSCDSSTTHGADGEKHTYYYNKEREEEVVAKLSEVIGRNLPGVRIMLVGTWIWLDGDTKPVKDELKELGFRWHSKREKWYWNTGGYRKRDSNADFGAIAAKYGYQEFYPEDKKKLTA